MRIRGEKLITRAAEEKLTGAPSFPETCGVASVFVERVE